MNFTDIWQTPPRCLRRWHGSARLQEKQATALTDYCSSRIGHRKVELTQSAASIWQCKKDSNTLTYPGPSQPRGCAALRCKSPYEPGTKMKIQEMQIEPRINDSPIATAKLCPYFQIEIRYVFFFMPYEDLFFNVLWRSESICTWQKWMSRKVSSKKSNKEQRTKSKPWERAFLKLQAWVRWR